MGHKVPQSQYFHGLWHSFFFSTVKDGNINDSELFAGSMSYQDYCRVRGVYIGDMFYLVTEKGIVSYNIQKDYEQTGTLKWEA